MYTTAEVIEFCTRASDEYLLGQLAVHRGYLKTLESHIARGPVSDRLLGDADNIRMVVQMESAEVARRSIGQ